jgi:dipeptidyl-peptidase-4
MWAVLLALLAPPSQQDADLQFLRDIAQTRSYRLGKPTMANPLPDGSRVLFLRAEARKAQLRLYSFDVASGAVRELITPEQVTGGAAESLSPEEKARRERMRVSVGGFTSYSLSHDGSKVLVSLSGKVYVVTIADGKAREVAAPDKSGPPFDPRLSPDGQMVSFVRGGELWVAKVADGKAHQLTRGATELTTHAQAEFVAQEEMGRFTGYWWSPDSKQLVYEVADSSKVEKLWIGDPAHATQEIKSSPYPRPGKTNAEVTLGIIPVGGGKTTWITWDRDKYPYLTRVRWQEHAPLTIEVQTREQRDLSLLAVDAKNGKTQELLHEHDDVWINLGNEYDWLRDGSAFLWSTERGGAWQLELHDREGKLSRVLTEAPLGLKGLRHIDEKAGTVVVAAGDPVDTQLWSVPLAGGPAKALSTTPGAHDATYARDAGVYIMHSASDKMEVHRADGSVAGELPSVAEKPPFSPRVEIVKAGGYYCALVRPRNFDPKKKYPVIVHVYGGPTATVVHVAPGAYLTEQWMADHGYIVALIDNKGTPGRGRAWERLMYGKFAELPLEGQVEGLKALGAHEPAMDLARVGIIGHSFGGYMGALAVMRRPDVFKAGVASAPVVDWLDYDTHYTERYLGVPTEKDKSLYDANSILKYVDKLERPLLIVHGTADDNVHFDQSLKLADALFRAGKKFEFAPLAGQTHMFYQPDLTFRYWQRIFAFFKQNL